MNSITRASTKIIPPAARISADPSPEIDPVATGPIPFDQFMAELEGNYSAPLAAKGTWRKMSQVMRELQALGVTSTAELTMRTVSAYVASRSRDESPWTTRSVLSSLRAACGYAEAQGYLRVNPFRTKSLGKWVRLTPPQEDRHLSRQEIRAILDRMTLDIAERVQWSQWRARRIYALTAIIAYAALRKSEALHLQMQDVDVASRIIHVVQRGARFKTAASSQPVAMPTALVPILEDWFIHRMDGPPDFAMPKECPWVIPTIDRRRPWVSGTLNARALDIFQDAAVRAGVHDATFQALRRSWATHAEFYGLGAAMIQRQLRHTNPITSEKWYRFPDLPNMREKVSGMDF
jgi:integrase